jgi:hypothetical protein
MDPEESSIERLKRTLYSRNEAMVPKEKRTPVTGEEPSVPTDWGGKRTFDVSYPEMNKRNNSFFNKFLIYSFIFFLVACGIAIFIFFGGINMISSNNVDIKITGPSSVSSGEEFDMGLSIANLNRADLEEVSLFIDYPSGSLAPGEDNKSLSHEKISLGNISKGNSTDYTVRALLFGEKDSVKTFDLRLEYKVKGSNAVFSKEKTYDVSIGSSPLLLNVSYPQETNSGQPITLTISITSNSSVVVKNSLLKIEYPYGFTYKSSSISPVRDNSVWKIGDLKDGDKKTIIVTGILVGQDSEDRSFRVSVGTQDSSSPVDFTTALAESISTVGIRKSFFSLSVVSTSGQNLITIGQFVPMAIRWENTLPDKVINAHIEATLSGNVLDRSSVNPSEGGFWRSIDNTIIWDKTTTNSLVSLMPGDNGQVSFSFASLKNTTGFIKNPHIDVHVVMTADRTGLSAGTVSSPFDYSVKISSSIGITAKSFRNSGPFSNSGSIPPRADKETTYTITWTLTNTSNDLKDTTVSTVLPQGVLWKGQVSPSSEKITYNPDSRTVSWGAGNVSAGVGYSFSPREVSFQVGLTPSVSQIGLEASLTGNSNVSANDTYTGEALTASAQSVSTHYSDPSYSTNDNIVVK